MKDIYKAYFGELQFEDVLTSDKAKELTFIFRNFLNVKTKSNFNDINFGLSSVDKIIKLKKSFYGLLCENLDFGFVDGNKIFNDFFEEFITFTRRIFLKKQEDYEDDIFDINEYRAIFGESDDDDDNDNDDDDNDNDNDNDDDFKNEILNILDTDNETDTDTDNDTDIDSESESDSESD